MNNYYRITALLTLLVSPAAFAIPGTGSVIVISEPASPALLFVGLIVMLTLIGLRSKTAILRVRADESAKNNRR